MTPPKPGKTYTKTDALTWKCRGEDDITLAPDPGEPFVPGWGYPTWSDHFTYIDPVTSQPAIDPAKWNIRTNANFGQTFDYGYITADAISVEDGICHIRSTWRTQSEVTSTQNSVAGGQTGTYDGATNTITFTNDHGMSVGDWVWADVLSGAMPDGYYYIRSTPTKKTATLSLTFTVWQSNSNPGGPGAEYDIPATTGTLRLYKHRWMWTGYMDHRVVNAGDVQPVSQNFGRWEIRAKVPADPFNNRGTLAAFWLRNQGTVTIGGPAGAEIDIMEAWGSGPDAKYNPGKSTFTVFRYTSVPTGGTQWEKKQNYEATTPPYVDDDFHVWTFERTPTYYRAYRDGVMVADWSAAAFPELYESTFTNPFHVRLNLHIGPSARYWGLPDPNNKSWSAEPMDFQIDYVRIWAWPGED